MFINNIGLFLLVMPCKGNIPWNKGKKGLQIAWNKGLDRSDPRVAKYADKQLGKHCSAETIEKISSSKKGILNLKKRGSKHSIESKKKMSVSHIGIKSWNTGLNRKSDERVNLQAIQLDGKKPTPQAYKKWREYIDNLSANERTECARHAASFLTKEQRSSAGISSVLKQKKKGTEIENIIEQQLKQMNIQYIPQKRIESTLVDFFIPPNICIFADGNYWHNLPDVKARDEKLNPKLKEEGFVVLRFWEMDIKTRPEFVYNTILKHL